MRNYRLHLLFVVSLAALQPLCAQTLYFNPNLTATGNPPTSGAGGTGAWNNSTANWWNGTANVVWAGGVADFRNTAGTATIASGTTVNATGINASITTTIAGADATSFLNLTGSAAIANSSSLTISARLSGSNGFTKTGSGFLFLSGNNSGLSGPVDIQAGRVTVNTSSNALGTGSVTIASGASLNAGVSTSNNYFISGIGVSQTSGFLGALYTGSQTVSGTVTLNADARIGSGNITGKITGAYNLELGADGGIGLAATSTITLGNADNDYTGNTTIITHATAAGANTVVKVGAGSNGVANGVGKGDLYIRGGANSQAILDLNAQNETINGLNSSGTASNAIVENNAGGQRILTIGDADANGNFGGIIRDGTQSVRISKTGAGTQIFSGTNTYSGQTGISAGTLLINGDQSGATGNVVVGPAGTLGGTGIIGGATTVSGGLSAGSNGVGLLSFANGLTLNSTANTIIEIDSLLSFDSINVSGALSYGGTLTLDFGFNAEVGQTFDLFAFTSQSGSFSSLSFLNTGYNGTFDYGTGILTLTAVPEPSAAILFLAGGGMAVVARRRSNAVSC